MNNIETLEMLPKKFSVIEETTVPISIKFENISYSVKENRSKYKQLLDGVSGQFSSGEFTAILGASGCGKTTLLNILSGYVKENVKGAVQMNQEACDLKLLRKLSAYIMQNDLLQPHLTPEEQMMIVAKLKLLNGLEEKKLIVNELMEVFNLEKCFKTRVEKLSGGEKKRLSIALELISNPSVIFLDEPTSGLDSVTIDLCIDIFRRLARTGKTVICTIHQPSVAIMNQFDQVYFLAKGSCIYNGSTDNILPFLSSLNLNCPLTYSYSEFVIETVEINPETIQFLSNAIENGKFNYRTLTETNNELRQNQNVKKLGINKGHASFWTQFTIILHRMLLQQFRNRVGLSVQFYSHFLVAVMFGITFFGIGNNAKTLVSNAYFTWSCLLFLVYSSFIAPVLVFPFEMEILRREYLNRWYSLTPYYLALSIRSLPVKIVLEIGLLLISYLLSDQPLEFQRFFRFTLTYLLLSMVSDAYGLAVGCTFNATKGAILAPCFFCPLAIFALYGFGFGSSIGITIKIIMRFSYLRFAYIASLYALMENRAPLPCYEIFCYYTDPKRLIRDLGIENNSYWIEILGLLGYFLFFRVIAYLTLKRRMREELTGKNSEYVTQILKVNK